MPVTLQNWKRQDNRLWPDSQTFWNDALLFMLGSVGFLYIQLIGSLPYNELLLLPMLPFLLMKYGARAFRREYLWFYVFLGGWLFATVFGDIYNGNYWISRLKGVARVVFFGLDFIVLAILIDRKQRGFIAFALGLAVAEYMNSRTFAEDPLTQWKFGSAEAVSFVGLIIASYFYSKKRYTICFGIGIALSLLNLARAFRSEVAEILVPMALILPILENKGGGVKSKAQEISRILLILVLGGGTAYLSNAAVKYGALHGWFPEAIQAKFLAQESGKLGVLVGGRPETLVAIQAIRDRPIIGHGSFAPGGEYILLEHELTYKYGYTETEIGDPNEEGGIPTHSHLTMAWVENGILGGAFWIYIIVLSVRGIMRLIVLRPPLAPLYGFCLVSFIWDIFYTPMGAIDRMWGCYYMLVGYTLVNAPLPGPARLLRRGQESPLKKVVVSTRTSLAGRTPLRPILPRPRRLDKIKY
jgi:hypothetical protein